MFIKAVVFDSDAWFLCGKPIYNIATNAIQYTIWQQHYKQEITPDIMANLCSFPNSKDWENACTIQGLVLLWFWVVLLYVNCS